MTDDIDEWKFIITYTHGKDSISCLGWNYNKNGADISANEGPSCKIRPIKKEVRVHLLINKLNSFSLF